MDQVTLTGDILNQVKNKIETASYVIAEISNNDPIVFLEIGYAWGKDRKTILFAKDTSNNPFNVKNQKCIKYDTIKQLDEKLTKEL